MISYLHIMVFNLEVVDYQIQYKDRLSGSTAEITVFRLVFPAGFWHIRVNAEFYSALGQCNGGGKYCSETVEVSWQMPRS